MKKFLYLLLLLPLGLLPTSCDDDDDKVPDVGIQATVSGGVVDNNTIYVVQGEPLVIEQMQIVNHTGKDAAIGVVNYYIDGVGAGQSLVAPYRFEFFTDNLPIGNHVLTAEMPVYVVDYPICFGAFSFPLQVVEDASALPGEPSTTTFNGVIREK